MTASFRMACYIFMAGITLIGGACAPSATGKTDSAASGAAGAGQPGGDQRAGEGQRGKTGESDTESSLKQLQEGKSTATAASSPLKDVFFEFDRYDLTSDARTTLRANADWLKSNSSTRVEIEGHCDERGTNEYNLALGAKRAQAAREFLSTLGIPADRLSTISYGEEIPVCREHSESCWQQNRRARFVIVQGRSTS
jgi:peptidoglycan-associated lipoprotein